MSIAEENEAAVGSAPAAPWWMVQARALAAAVVAVIGGILVFVGWWGASGTTYVPSQLAYIASGSVGGLALIAFACLLYWTHERAREAALFERLDRSLVALADLADALVEVEAERESRSPAPAGRRTRSPRAS